ncbi:MAG: hypothetical protein V4738_14795 [Pseudomonadota bacterium]
MLHLHNWLAPPLKSAVWRSKGLEGRFLGVFRGKSATSPNEKACSALVAVCFSSSIRFASEEGAVFCW